MKRPIYFILMLTIFLSACGQVQVDSSQGETLTWQEQYDLGVRYLSEGNYEEAIIAFTAAIEIDPKRAEAYAGRGDAYVLTGRTEENLSAAQTDYEAAIELDETLPEAWIGLADVYIHLGDYKTALETLRRGLSCTGNNPSIADKLRELEGDDVQDASGRLLRRNYYKPDGTLNFYHIFIYGEGDFCRTESYDADGTYQGYDIQYPSEDGLSLYEESYNPDGSCTGRGISVKDETGRWMYSVSLDENGNEIARNEAAFDSNGNEIGHNSYVDGVLMGYARLENGKIVYYDADGNVTMVGDS